MPDIARLLIDGNGIIRSVDRAFCTIMRGNMAELSGMEFLAITAPADRAKCTELFIRLCATGTPVRTTKRLIRRDGTHVWVHARADRTSDHPISVAPTDPADARYVALIEPSTQPSEWIEPERLLQLAQMIQLSRPIRETIFSPGLFADHAWNILLHAYIGEAQGRILTGADLHASLDISLANIARWLRALESEELIEAEERGRGDVAIAPVRLSACGLIRFERYLTDFSAAITATVPVAVD